MLLDDIKSNPNLKQINLIFMHGIGDCIMFLPTIKKLMVTYPDIIFNIKTLRSQEHLFKYFNIISEPYDEKNKIPDTETVITRTINFDMPMKNITKNDTCCIKEIGFGEIDEIYKIYPENTTSKIIGTHFQNTCLPDLINPSEQQANDVWNIIKNKKLIPLEVHFLHSFANPRNKKYDFINFTTRSMECNITNMFNVINSCHKFIGVLSGPAHCASMLLGLNNVLFIENKIKITDTIKTKCNVTNSNSETFKKDIEIFLGKN